MIRANHNQHRGLFADLKFVALMARSVAKMVQEAAVNQVKVVAQMVQNAVMILKIAVEIVEVILNAATNQTRCVVGRIMAIRNVVTPRIV
jgi:hypothetical protein